MFGKKSATHHGVKVCQSTSDAFPGTKYPKLPRAVPTATMIQLPGILYRYRGLLSFGIPSDCLGDRRATNEHGVAQTKGRKEIFSNYRLRVAGVIRDYGMHEREQVPGRQPQSAWWIGLES